MNADCSYCGRTFEIPDETGTNQPAYCEAHQSEAVRRQLARALVALPRLPDGTTIVDFVRLMRVVKDKPGIVCIDLFGHFGGRLSGDEAEALLRIAVEGGILKTIHDSGATVYEVA